MQFFANGDYDSRFEDTSCCYAQLGSRSDDGSGGKPCCSGCSCCIVCKEHQNSGNGGNCPCHCSNCLCNGGSDRIGEKSGFLPCKSQYLKEKCGCLYNCTCTRDESGKLVWNPAVLCSCGPDECGKSVTQICFYPSTTFACNKCGETDCRETWFLPDSDEDSDEDGRENSGPCMLPFLGKFLHLFWNICLMPFLYDVFVNMQYNICVEF